MIYEVVQGVPAMREGELVVVMRKLLKALLCDRAKVAREGSIFCENSCLPSHEGINDLAVLSHLARS